MQFEWGNVPQVSCRSKACRFSNNCRRRTKKSIRTCWVNTCSKRFPNARPYSHVLPAPLRQKRSFWSVTTNAKAYYAGCPSWEIVGNMITPQFGPLFKTRHRQTLCRWEFETVQSGGDSKLMLPLPHKVRVLNTISRLRLAE